MHMQWEWERHLSSGVHVEGDVELMRQLREARALRVAPAPMPGQLSAIAEAARVSAGPGAAPERALAAAVAEHTAPVRPTIEIPPVSDLRDRVTRHHDEAVRRDELTRLQAQADFAASRRVAPPETTEQRQARRYQACVDAGLSLPDNDYARLPAGVGLLAQAEGVKRPSFTADVKAHIARLAERRKAAGGR